MKAIDLFCGCGGISSGLSHSGITVIAGADIESKYLCTFTRNFPKAQSVLADLAAISPEAFMESVGISHGELDLLAGGPPCQGFSKNTPRKQRSADSDNNKLVTTFLDYCAAIFPKIILMENVAEMKNSFDQAYTNEIEERLTALGYQVNHAVLNAADYGIPQMRRRAFFIATRIGEKLQFPPPTHFPEKSHRSLLHERHYVPVWDAIGDLPSLQHGEGKSKTAYACAPFSSYQETIRDNEKDVSNHVAKKLQPTQFARMNALKPGQGLKDLPVELQVKSGYSGAYGRLTKEMVCRTITRWVFHPGSGRWGHPVDARTLSIREVARIQGFFDSYEFVGSYTQQAGQLGNAAPPLLIKQLATCITSQIR